MKVDCNWIERVIYAQMLGSNRNHTYPGITPRGWWECDMISLTKADYWSEFEIKMTRSDFKADFKKSIDGWAAARMRGAPKGTVWRRSNLDRAEYEAPLYKHELLASECTKGPKQFWFCTPEGLLTEDDIPEYAGWIEFPEPSSNRPSPFYSGYAAYRKFAPNLKGEKFSEARKSHMLSCIPYRFQRDRFERIPELVRNLTDVQLRNQLTDKLLIHMSKMRKSGDLPEELVEYIKKFDKL